MTAHPIPSFGLYGEDDAHGSAGFVHIETIAARSSLHDWEIAPHRHDHGIQVLLIETGRVDASLDGRRLTLEGPAHVTVPAGAVHGFRFEPDTRGAVLTLSSEFASRAGSPADPLRALLSEGAAEALPKAAARRVAWLAREMLTLKDGEQAGGLRHALAETLLRCLPAPADRTEDGGTRDARRLAAFRAAVEAHFASSRQVGFYAEALGITPRSLARLCRARLGCSPLDAINRRRAIEAQRLLRYTGATIAQVADELGFADPSWFSRFYLRMTGRRPQAERAPSARPTSVS